MNKGIKNNPKNIVSVSLITLIQVHVINMFDINVNIKFKTGIIFFITLFF